MSKHYDWDAFKYGTETCQLMTNIPDKIKQYVSGGGESVVLPKVSGDVVPLKAMK